MDKWVQGGNVWVRCLDGRPLNLNSDKGADTFLGLCETVAELEGRLHRREVRATKKRKPSAEESQDEARDRGREARRAKARAQAASTSE